MTRVPAYPARIFDSQSLSEDFRRRFMLWSFYLWFWTFLRSALVSPPNSTQTLRKKGLQVARSVHGNTCSLTSLCRWNCECSIRERSRIQCSARISRFKVGEHKSAYSARSLQLCDCYWQAIQLDQASFISQMLHQWLTCPAHLKVITWITHRMEHIVWRCSINFIVW